MSDVLFTVQDTCVLMLFIIEFLLFSAGSEADDLTHFEIDSKSGDISTTELFSHNTEPFYTIKVTARDSGATSQEDTAVIHVQVQSLIYDFHLK